MSAGALELGAFTQRLRRIAEQRLGVNVVRGGLAGALDALARRKHQELGPTGMFIFLDRLEQGGVREHGELVGAVTVQHSWWFRDAEQLFAASTALAERAASQGFAHAWVPACATGEDAYSLAALTRDAGTSVKVFGTDVSPAALERARVARYDALSTRGVPEAYRSMLVEATGGAHRVVPALLERVTFAQHNLLDPAPPSAAPGGAWDVILCRNVFIYLTPAAARRAMDHFARGLAPEGVLVLGASDIVFEPPPELLAVSLSGRLAFVRRGARRARQGNAVCAPVRAAPEPRSGPPSLAPRPAAVHSAPPSRPLARGCHAGSSPPRAPTPPPQLDDTEPALEALFDGMADYLAGDLGTALRRLRAASFLLPDLWPADYYLALAYDGLGRSQEAVRHYARVVALIERDAPIPAGAATDFGFLARDVLATARRACERDRAAAPRRR